MASLQPVTTVPAGVVVTQPAALVPGQTAGPLWLTDLCGGCNGETCCAACCCPCCMVGANAKMLRTGVIVDPCCGGSGPECVIHGMLGGLIQGVAIFGLGPLAALIHFGSCYACGIRSQLRTKYGIDGSSMADCCIHYWCGPCAVCQEYEENKKRITMNQQPAVVVVQQPAMPMAAPAQPAMDPPKM